MSERFCKTCKHCRQDGGEWPGWACAREANTELFNLVTGVRKTPPLFHCESERVCELMGDGRVTCGKEGRYWEALA
jgi:hypothetical protein